MKKFTSSFLLSLLLFAPFGSVSAQNGAAATSASGTTPLSAAVFKDTLAPEVYASDALLRALNDEMKRTTESLQLKEFGKPYFVEYTATDENSFGAEARFGALVNSGTDHTRYASVQLRLGSYDFDNTNLFSVGATPFSTALALDDDYSSMRYDLWLASDAAYKAAVEQLSSKKAYLQNNTVDEKLPDLTRETPQTKIEQRAAFSIEKPKLEELVRKLSAVFKKYPQVTDSNVSMFVRSQTDYLLNNEGTRLRRPSNIISLNIYAQSQTSDGLRLTPSRHIYARTFGEMPSEAELLQTAEKLAQDLTALSGAPAFDETYIGPALLTERASIQLFAQLFAPNLSGGRSPLTSRGASSGIFGERINRRVLPPFFDIVDDPTQTKINGKSVLGSYDIDEQGVSAKPLKIVENGILKTLLTSRLPSKQMPTSNGRARSIFGKPFISNLIVTAKEGKTFDELKAELLAQCKAQSLPYGLIFREIDSTFTPSGYGFSPPIMAYKVYPDGREELVRGLTVESFGVREMRQILAAGNDSATLNHLNGNGHSGSGIPYSVTAPSVLLDELVVRRDTDKQKPLILSNPYFDKKTDKIK